ncbi:hypothetical protein M231_00207 [Tremella mesenterica]|uniref:Uncharacterized protein n=1 Tax=Tremella mesenterica TaxID=5217 RepID=A0A4Q1BWT8_TREME|nr:hypothetical protein M231_00207 [Tremella mesenterica]
MDTNNLEPEIDRFARSLVSLDPVDFDASINEFFEANAVFDSGRMLVRGSSRIKKIAWLFAAPAKESGIVAKPDYDEKTQLLKIKWKRTFVLPPIPSYLPIVSNFSKAERTFHASVDFHLAADEEGEEGGNATSGRKLYVTKMGPITRDLFPLEGLIPYYFIKGILGLIALFVANIALFYHNHPPSKGIARMIFVGVYDTVEAIWNWLNAERARRQAIAEQWRSGKEKDLRDFLTNAKTSAGDLSQQLEARAKKAGIPVEDYKRRASAIMSEMQKRASEAIVYFEGKEKDVKAKVKDTKHDVQKKALSTQGNRGDSPPQHHASGSEHNHEGSGSSHSRDDSSVSHDPESANATTVNDTSDEEEKHEQEDRPRTPMGGHDPTAPNAPSYAQAAAN